MKYLLAILLSFIMTEAPVLAIHGGYTLPGSTSLIGTYAGVMIPVADDLLVANVTDFGLNSLGLFTLGVPGVGLSNGTVIIFSGGNTFNGSIQALINPDPSVSGLLGIITASFPFTLNTIVSGSNVTQDLTATAQGSFDVVAEQDGSSVCGLGINLTGSSVINVSDAQVDNNNNPIIDEKITFDIEGFQQSSGVTTTGT